MTQQSFDRTQWLARRRKGLGSSDIAAIMGLSPFQTPLDIYRSKMGEVEEELTPPMLRGIYLEDVAVQLYVEKTGRRVRRVPLRQHPTHPMLLASADRQVLSDVTKITPTAALEVKCPGVHVFREIKDCGLRDYMILQMQHEALVYGYPQTSSAIFNAELFELIYFDLESDYKLQAQIVKAAVSWWQEHIEQRVPPRDEPQEPSVEIARVGGQLIRREDSPFLTCVADLVDVKQVKSAAEIIEKAAKDKLKALLGEYGIYEGGGAKIHYKQRNGRVSFDSKLLGALKPLDALQLATRLNESGVTLSVIQDAVEASRLDLKQLERRGAPYDEIRCYPVKEEG